MKRQTNATLKAHIIRCAPYLLLLVAGTVMAFFAPQAPTKVLPRTLSFAERVSYQRAIEDVYWRHRIWPRENPDPKPSLDTVMSEAQLEKKVEDYLFNSQTVQDSSREPLSAQQLQAEMERMATHSKQPEVLRELFQALGNDPAIIAECLARPVLTDRLIADLSAQHQTGRFESLRAAELQMSKKVAAIDSIAKAVRVNRPYQLPIIATAPNGCTDDTWTATSVTNAPTARWSHTAVWTGTEMIVWGGSVADNNDFNTGARYNPSTDSWTPTNTVNAPEARVGHTAIWTGTEMIVWGGETCCPLVYFKAGGRYNPSTDSWVATGTIQAPDGRAHHTAIWTGTEMIVWGGLGISILSTGGRYNPNTDSWTDTRTTDAPSARYDHTTVWTGSEMIVWGGTDGTGINYLNTGAKYDPLTNTWLATTTSNAPTGRVGHTAVWSGFEMIVWGGGGSVTDNTGGKYDPFLDSWTPTSTVNAPHARFGDTWVWTGSEMIVWGGFFNTQFFKTGGRYNPFADSWTATSTVNAPEARIGHTAVWTGTEMIVWGGAVGFNFFNTGGKYCAAVGPTPTPTPVPITLHGEGKKVRGMINTVRLTWSGATSANIDVYRDGVVIVTTANDGLYVDNTGNGNQAEYTYMVCEAGSQTCSNEVMVSFEQTINATWSTNPVSSDWNDPLNWTPHTVPNGPFAFATFNTSTITDISLSAAITVQDIVFNAGASAFTITIPAQKTLTLTGAGVINRSAQEQNFVLTKGTIILQNTATAGSNVVYTCDGAIHFNDSSNAGKTMFVFSGGTIQGHGGGGADFRDNSSAADATFIVEAGIVAGAYGGSVSFFDGPGVSAGNATIIANGATVANARGGQVDFFAILPSEPTIIGNGGVNGGTGAEFIFFQDIPGNLAHFQLNGDAFLDISISGGVTIGSLEGDGLVDLGDFTLTVGGNNQDTLFSGLLDQINTEGGEAGLKKVGSGTLGLSHDNMFKGGITIAGGTVAIENQSGSASGSDGVGVLEGTLSGGGIIAGATNVGTGRGSGAFLAPGLGASTAKTLTIQSALTFKADSTYSYRVKTKRAEADQVIAYGVTIESGAQFSFKQLANKRLTAGTVFTAIDNVSANPIRGTFANLPDDSTFTIGNNTYQADYQGGDGNDLTLTVIP